MRVEGESPRGYSCRSIIRVRDSFEVADNSSEVSFVGGGEIRWRVLGRVARFT